MCESASMDVLLNRRRLAMERLKRENASVKSLKDRQAPAFEVEDRLRKLHELEERFDQVQLEIEEATSPDDLPSVINFRTDFETLFYSTKGLLTSLLGSDAAHVDAAFSSWRSCGSANSDSTYADPGSQLQDAVRALLETQKTLLTRQVAASTSFNELAVQLRERQIEPIDTKLPSYSLPIFKGDRRHWASFKDLFTSCVDQKNLTNALKLQLLLAHLDGEAKSLVSTYSITDANYTEVWDTLTEHYDKPKFAVSALVQEFCEQPVIKVSNLPNLRKLVSTSDEVIRQLKAMGPEYETRDPWLIYQILRKLDDSLRSQWAQFVVDIDNPTFADMLRFLKRKCDAFETCAAFGARSSEVKREVPKDDRKFNPLKKEIKSLTSVQEQVCPMCSDSHVIYQCSEFKGASVQERRELAQSARLCFNCLRANHCVKFCPSKSVCRTPQCQQKHHTLLCQSAYAQTMNTNDPAGKQELENEPSDEHANSNQVVSCSANVKMNLFTFAASVLPTAIINVKGRNNQFYKVRAMIDSGSQASLITERCMTRLALHRRNAKLLVSGISNCTSGETRGVVTLEISSRFNNVPVVQTQAYVLAKLARNLPEQQINLNHMKCLETLKLADPDFDKPGEIDVILGADVFLSILTVGKVKDENGFPVAINSTLGWIVAGRIGATVGLRSHPAIVSLHTELNVDHLLRQFWECERINQPLPLKQEDQKAVEIFQTTHMRDETGRFVVRLPFDDSKQALGESLATATQRLKAMERKFKADSDFEQQYRQFIREYLELGHMEPVPKEEIDIPVERRYYLPHHAVVKSDSVTTKLRVVFDGSCKSSSGISLNDKLLVGPNVNEDLTVVLTRFRTYAVAFMADAEKMYRQVKVAKDDIDFQRIVWRNSPDDPIEHYRLLTVTYGTACASYLAIASLRQAARDNQAEHPVAAERVIKNSYVDDFLSGADTQEEAVKLKEDIIKITSSAGFNLRKWASNDPQLVVTNSDRNQEEVPLQLSAEANPVKALGILWLPRMDTFAFKVNLDTSKPNTKRQLLSDAARLFDPLGWIAPVTVRIKILFQALWLHDVQWDDPLPATLNEEWTKIKEDLNRIEDIKLPRWISNHGGKIELHGFADASEAAYAAVVYSRTTDNEGKIHTSLVAAKTKVAPIQQVSLPRLELNAAVLLTAVLQRIMESLDHLDVTCFAWTDSTIVLEWLSSHPRKWKTYVANRTSMILDFLPRSSWNHVPSSENPADCASRGLLPALKRFCGRRGLPCQLWSDNGTNFIGADRQLKELLQSSKFESTVDHFLSNLGIKWTFITPSAPHMGGYGRQLSKA
ncbi:uncharacterized protein LOC134289861 [Aedes albopictus]|uniref:Peptidase aspartic putative domain-containing protein n=1 Tax=Aedes albopictus TaxID=7160 RepID=A0ABM1ZSX3_AEDAL